VAWSVDQVQNIVVTIFGAVAQPYCLCLYSDTTFTLQVHLVQELLFHLSMVDCPCEFQYAVSQGALSVIDMGYDGKISDFVHIIHGNPFSDSRCGNMIS